jgi:Cu+-exporting ATPase
VLIKSAAALQRLATVDTLVIDKTGTITAGRPRVTACEVTDGWSVDRILRLAASAEQNSEHPLAGAILTAAEERGVKLLDASQFHYDVGGGIRCKVDGHSVIAGTADYLSRAGVAASDHLASLTGGFQQSGQTAIHVGIDGKHAAVLAISDPIKPYARQAVQDLRSAGLHVLMLTGDNQTTANIIAHQVGITEVIAETRPLDKQRHIQRLKDEGRRVAMAGDGINDAPSLATADVGIAMATGTDVAMEASDITLLKGDLGGIVRAVGLSRRTMANIRQNLFFALVYNAMGIPIAAGLLYPFFRILLSPMLAAAAMSLSDVFVVGNALRLQRGRL